MRLAPALAAFAVLVLAAPAEARQVGRCAVPDKARVDANGDRLLVWSYERRYAKFDDELIGKVVACRRATGRSVRVVQTWDDGVDAREVGMIRVAGDYVAYFENDTGRHHFESVNVFDTVRAREVVSVGITANMQYGLWTGDSDVLALAVGRRGELAYVVQHPTDTDYAGRARIRRGLRAVDAGGSRLLDKGDGVEPASLAIAGRTVHWTNAGEPRSAPLR
jgi:hypothetical protein